MDPRDVRARRAFVAAHHPDRGGDPAAFVAGLAAFDRLHPGGAHSTPGPDRTGVRVVGVPARGPVPRLRRAVRRWRRRLRG